MSSFCSHDKRLRRILHKLEDVSSTTYRCPTTKRRNNIVDEQSFVNDDSKTAGIITNESIPKIVSIIQQHKRQRVQYEQEQKRQILPGVEPESVQPEQSNKDPIHQSGDTAASTAPIDSAASETVEVGQTKSDKSSSHDDNNTLSVTEISTDVVHSSMDNTSNNNSSTNNQTRGEIMIQQMKELQNVYIYGLLTVSKLQDLRNAPDAILPNTFST